MNESPRWSPGADPAAGSGQGWSGGLVRAEPGSDQGRSSVWLGRTQVWFVATQGLVMVVSGSACARSRIWLGRFCVWSRQIQGLVKADLGIFWVRLSADCGKDA